MSKVGQCKFEPHCASLTPVVGRTGFDLRIGVWQLGFDQHSFACCLVKPLRFKLFGFVSSDFDSSSG